LEIEMIRRNEQLPVGYQQ